MADQSAIPYNNAWNQLFTVAPGLLRGEKSRNFSRNNDIKVHFTFFLIVDNLIHNAADQ